MNETNTTILIQMAIQQEKESHAFYQEAANKVENKGVKQIFQELANEELGHQHLLERYLEDQSVMNRFKHENINYKIAETKDRPALSTTMKPIDAITLAMKREQEAAELYKELADNAMETNTKEALITLSNMELDHKRKLEDAFVNIGYPEDF